MNSSGFTLVEVLISSAILAIAIVGSTGEIVSQIQSESQMNTQLQARLIMNQVVSNVLSGASMYPQILSSSGASYVYVTCYRDDGSQLPAVNPISTTSIGVPLTGVASPPTGPAANGNVTSLGSGSCTWTTVATQDGEGLSTSPCVCQQNQGGYEAHVRYPTGSPHLAQVDVITLTNGFTGTGNPGSTIDARGYAVASRVISSGLISL